MRQSKDDRNAARGLKRKSTALSSTNRAGDHPPRRDDARRSHSRNTKSQSHLPAYGGEGSRKQITKMSCASERQRVWSTTDSGDDRSRGNGVATQEPRRQDEGRVEGEHGRLPWNYDTDRAAATERKKQDFDLKSRGIGPATVDSYNAVGVRDCEMAAAGTVAMETPEGLSVPAPAHAGVANKTAE